MNFIADKNEVMRNQIITDESKLRLDEVFPTIIDLRNPKLIEIDGKFLASLIVTNYSREMEGIFLDKVLSLDMDLQISMFYEKQNTYDVIKELTYNISNTGANIKISNENQNDIDTLSYIYQDAKYIRKQLQVGEEELYYLYLYILVYAPSKEELESDLQKIESVLSGVGLRSRRALYRQKQALMSTLPIFQNDKELKKLTHRNVLTSGLVATYPFISNEMYDDTGVLIGLNSFSNSLVMIDRFNSNKYKNGNMCVFGASGSGKSYFIKMMINRNRFLNITQYVIDPDREYIALCKNLNGTLINFSGTEHINVMDIRENSIDENESYLQSKISKLNVFFSMIFEEISQEESVLLEEYIIKVYNDYGIFFENSSLYEECQNTSFIKTKNFKDSKQMPKLEDVYNSIKKDKKLKKYSTILKRYISGSMSFLNEYTNVDVSNKLVVADIYDIEEEKIPIVMFIITELFWDKIKESRKNKKIIYLDEVWKLINKNEEAAEFVFKMFKTIRKFGGAATAITKDVTDFFALNDGKYGQSIINNSSTKVMFQLEENNIIKLADVLRLSEEEKYRLTNLERGKCLLHAGRNKVMIDVKVSKKEHELINTDISET